MAPAQLAIIKRDHHVGGVGEPESLLLEIAYDEDPVASVVIEWHGDLELDVKVTKYFGGKTPGITTAWQLQALVMETISLHLEKGETDFSAAFLRHDRIVSLSNEGESEKADIRTF